MPYPSYMQESIRKVEATREKRLKEEVPYITVEQRKPLLKENHPDYVEAGIRELLVGPNNSGKTTLLQAIATWYLGLQRWIQVRGEITKAKKRTGVPITRKDFTVLPLREMNLLWTNRQTHLGKPKPGTPNLMEIILTGKNKNIEWKYGLEFQYANMEMLN